MIEEASRVTSARVVKRIQHKLNLVSPVNLVFSTAAVNERELVKLISKQKSLAYVEDTARLLEYESGGVLVSIEKVPKGFALIYYRGKNYQRPISLRRRNLLTKAKALKRSIATQHHEALSQHIPELEKTIEQMQNELTAKNPSHSDSEWENDDDEEEEKDDESDWGRS
ncbi:hypothetical protein DY000_02042497 [Brassica cretica]|uniref:CRM domain-containing protein n=1 Tax=Brassica cretica TaxID=69181 RepID=A0ABQ7BKU5_BRACR|nr:hypothetical protein DY000_02042497 [Brassica cretica]